MFPTIKKEALYIMNHFGYQVFCLDQFSRWSPKLSALYGTQKRYDSPMDLLLFFSFGSEYSMVIGKVVADQNVYGTCGKS